MQDLERSHDFFTCLGLKFEREQHGKGPVHYACATDDLVLELYAAKGEATTTRLGFSGLDVDAALDRLNEAGFADEPRQLSRGGIEGVCVTDPDGNTVELWP